jgi:hypothetical protein
MLDIRLGSPQRLERLAVFPLLNREPVELPYTLLSDAVAAGTVRVTEVRQGQVPTLGVENLDERPVLVLDGEQLIGAKQNRTTNRSILLPGKSETEIPVSCMEQGRWRFTSREFTASPDHAPSKVRRQARDVEVAHVMRRVAAAPEVLTASQAGVWSEIRDLSRKLGVRSDTSALDEAYEARRIDLRDWAQAFPLEDKQVGLLAITPKGPIGLDVVGGQALYARVHQRLLNGYLMDALEEGAVGSRRAYRLENASPAPEARDDGSVEDAARGFMRGVTSAQFTQAPTVGLGLYSVLSGTVVGGELVESGRLAHLCAFPSRRESPERKREWRM